MRRSMFALLGILGFALAPSLASAHSMTNCADFPSAIFCEDFNGYTSFPVENPAGDPMNPGVPEISEGADEYWLGGRFETPDSGTIDQDLGVQHIGGGDNLTPVGRFEDEAGLILQIGTINLMDVELEFDWRTFSVGTGDKFVAGYYVGDITGLSNAGGPSERFKTMTSGSFAWSNWTEIVRAQSSSHQHVSISLPSNESSIYVAFWMDNGEGDFGKVDNVLITGTVIPEPSTVGLLAAGLAGLAAIARRRRA